MTSWHVIRSKYVYFVTEFFPHPSLLVSNTSIICEQFDWCRDTKHIRNSIWYIPQFSSEFDKCTKLIECFIVAVCNSYVEWAGKRDDAKPMMQKKTTTTTTINDELFGNPNIIGMFRHVGYTWMNMGIIYKSSAVELLAVIAFTDATDVLIYLLRKLYGAVRDDLFGTLLCIRSSVIIHRFNVAIY